MRTDANGFVTCQTLRALDDVPETPALADLRDRALGYLARCGSPTLAGAYRFWPPGEEPQWAARIQDDADDTALIAGELLRHGRLPRSAVLDAAAAVASHRVARLERLSPQWIRPGAFLTWLAEPERATAVDCTVNANVVGFLCAAGLGDFPGVDAACATVEAALEWAGASERRARTLSPFYPAPAELVLAVRRAIAAGARGLERAGALIETLPWARPADVPDPERPVCGAPYGHAVWRCRAVHDARQLAFSGKSRAAAR